MTRWLNGLQPWGIFFLRLVLGTAMVYHGWSKVIPAGGPFHHNATAALDHFSHYIVSLGLPPWMGYLSALTEFVGGILVLVGLFTRFAAFMIAGNLIVALLYVNIHHGYAGSEYTLALLAMAFLLMLAGAGKLALDRKIGFV